MRLVQIRHPEQGRRIALIDGNQCLLLQGYSNLYDLAQAAISSGSRLSSQVEAGLSGESFDYVALYKGESDWNILPAFDHPQEPARCLVSGTGLTHKASAQNRNAMHEKEPGEKAPVTDSMRMFEWGLEGGNPASGTVGVQPEWFYKGNGNVLKGHGECLSVPSYADDGGEEPEIAGAYLVDSEGRPRRLGFAVGNEFSDHIMEKKNYLYLAPSKLRSCAIGPELVVEGDFEEVSGKVSIERDGVQFWSKSVVTGEKNMSHSLANLEHHHFKYEAHRQPGDVHIHFYGADAFSFGEGVALQDGDVMVVSWDGFGRALRNPIVIDPSRPEFVQVNSL